MEIEGKEEKNMLEIKAGLTADAPTSKVHARMTQPTLIFAEMCEEETEELLSPGGGVKRENKFPEPGPLPPRLLECKNVPACLAQKCR